MLFRNLSSFGKCDNIPSKPNPMAPLHSFCCYIQVLFDLPLCQRGPSKSFSPQPHSVRFDVPNSVRYREIFWRDTMSPDVSVPKFREMDAISRYIVSCDIVGYRIWFRIYCDISWDITSNQPKTPGETTSTRSYRLVAVYCLFLARCLFPLLALSPSGHFCRPSVVRQLDTSQHWPYHEQTSNLYPHDSACCQSAR